MSEEQERQNALMVGIQQMADVVALYTGVKQQFIDNGWSVERAEEMVVALARAGGAS